MRIVSTRIDGFRNLAGIDLGFSPRVNLFMGENGQGKTNLLEALNFLALGKSHRSSRNEELIGFDTERLWVELVFENEDRQQTQCRYSLERGGRVSFQIDGERVPKRVDLIGRLVTVFFSPDSVFLVRGSPDHRRRFLDRGLATIEPSYLRHVTSYYRGLRHKARLLQDVRRMLRSRDEVRGELEAWNEKLARLAAHVCLGRARYAVRLAPPATTAYNRLTNRAEDLELVYLPKLNSVAENLDQREKNDWSIGDLEQEIRAEFAYIGQDEVRRGRPLTGPQLDDCEVRLARRDLRTYGSQGETRTAALSLILAQSEIVHEQRRVRPILFFDDIFSELDRKRAQKLREMTAEDHQVFIASAREDDVAGWRPKGLRKWEVAGGKMDEIDAETTA